MDCWIKSALLPQDVSDALRHCGNLRDCFTWRRLAGLLSGGMLLKILWAQYGACFHKRVPPYALGLPVFGHTLTLFRKSAKGLFEAICLGPRPVVLTNFLFQNWYVMTYSIYVEYVQKLELNGEFRSVYPKATSRIVGENSILVLPGGQGHKHHKRLRTKILANLAPKPCLEILPDITAEVRKMLDELADATTKDGFTSFGDPAEHMAAKVSALQITAGLSENLQLRVERLTDTAMEGLMAFPIDFGRYTAFGRAMQARKELKQIIDQRQTNLVFDKRNILADLVTSSQSGEQFSTDEVVDTIITLLVAGKMTTADVLPHVFVKLSQHQEWAAKVAQEKLEFNSIEEDSAALRVVLECIRLNPPLGGVGRIRSTALDLGTHGRIPPNCPFAYNWRNELRDLGGEDFNPDIWTPDFVRRHGTLAFGGNQPHTCIGRNLALLELQVFARMLCRDYDFRALNTELIVKPNKPLAPAFKDGLRVVVARKP